MSTSYYRLRDPFSSMRLKEGKVHDRVTLWEGGALAGTLVVRGGTGKRVALIFADQDCDDSKVPMRTHWGGSGVGAVVTVNDRSLADDITLVSEYGDVLTVAKVMAREGAKRKDGMPTELCGYEDKADK